MSLLDLDFIEVVHGVMIRFFGIAPLPWGVECNGDPLVRLIESGGHPVAKPTGKHHKLTRLENEFNIIVKFTSRVIPRFGGLLRSKPH